MIKKLLRGRFRSKRLLIAFLSLLTLGGGLIWLLFVRHPTLLKAAFGTARPLYHPIKAEVRLDGEAVPTARIFPMKTYCDGQPVDRLVVWLPVSRGIEGREIYIISKDTHASRRFPTVGQPNSTRSDYDLFLGRVLLQSESGCGAVDFGSAKSDTEEPQLEVNEQFVRFKIPDEEWLPLRRKQVVIYLFDKA